MSDYDTINTFLVDIWGRINKIEERSLAAGLGSDISITEIHIIEKIGDNQPRRMSEVAKALGVTLATLTVACDKLESKGLTTRARDARDKRVVNVSLTARGQAVYEYHKQFHQRMIEAALGELTPQETAILAESLLKLQRFFLSEE
ncbi:MAG: MarR family transcriptional regulator [Butyricicoccus sp.]|nr:MarR family transcriptional regulator [Butyricicoccus sp.]